MSSKSSKKDSEEIEFSDPVDFLKENDLKGKKVNEYTNMNDFSVDERPLHVTIWQLEMPTPEPSPFEQIFDFMMRQQIAKRLAAPTLDYNAPLQIGANREIIKENMTKLAESASFVIINDEKVKEEGTKFTVHIAESYHDLVILECSDEDNRENLHKLSKIHDLKNMEYVCVSVETKMYVYYKKPYISTFGDKILLDSRTNSSHLVKLLQHLYTKYSPSKMFYIEEDHTDLDGYVDTYVSIFDGIKYINTRKFYNINIEKHSEKTSTFILDRA